MRAVITLAFLSGIVAAQTAEPQPKASIHGAVKDTTGAPVAGVEVTANMTASGPVALTMADGATVVTHVPLSSHTDEAGSYSLTGLLPASYSVLPECAPTPKRVKLDAGQEATVDFVCPTNPTISGHVLEPNEDPAVDAFVWLLKSEYQGGVLKQIVIGPKVTGEDGSYTFDKGLEPNRRYYVIADRDVPDELLTAAPADFPGDRDPIEVPTYYPSATRIDSATPVVLQPGENREQVDIKVANAGFYCVEGKISSSGTPVSSNFAIQDVALAGTRLVRLRTGSAEDGKYHVCGLPAGSYRLATEDSFTEFAVTDSDVQHVDLSVDAAHLTLRVDWEDPLVPKLDTAAEAILRKFAALSGLGDAPSDDELKQFVARFRRDSPDGQELAALALRLSQSHEFTDEQWGEFWRQVGARPDVVGVTLAGTINGLSESLGAQVPSESAFKEGIPPGDYTVHAQLYGPSFGYAKEVEYNSVKLADDTLRVAPGAEGTLHIVLARDTATVSVGVADADGKPVPNATVIVVPDSVTSVPLLSRLVIIGQTDQTGSYTSRPMAPGKYRVIAINQPVRWGVPEDLEKVLLVMFQAKDIELDSKATLQVALEPVPIY